MRFQIILLLFFVCTICAQNTNSTQPDVNNATNMTNDIMNRFTSAVQDACTVIQQRWKIPLSQLNSQCHPIPACNPIGYLTEWSCNRTYGMGSYCNCNGFYISNQDAVFVEPQNPDPSMISLINETKCRTCNIGVEFAEIATKYQLFSLFAGFQSGAHVSWPARPWSTVLNSTTGCRVPTQYCPEFDPRNRVWYQDASGGRKNIVIILDVSASMGDSLVEAKNAVNTILSTLFLSDWVGVIAFSSSVTLPPLFPSPQLIPASKSNIANLTAWVNDLNLAPEPTQYDSAFTSAFQFLTTKTSESGCHDIIIIFSDGKPTAGATDSALFDYISSLNQQLHAIIFTFEVRGIDPTASSSPLHQISCQNEGVHVYLSDSISEKNIQTKLNQYYRYLDIGLKRKGVFFTEPYLECCGMGEVTSVAFPCYDGEDILIGVVGSSIPLNLIDNHNFLNESEQCVPLAISTQDLQTLRGPDCLPFDIFVASVAGEIAGIVIIVVVLVVIIFPLIFFLHEENFLCWNWWPR